MRRHEAPSWVLGACSRHGCMQTAMHVWICHCKDYYSLLLTSLRGRLPALLLVRKPRLMELQEPAVTAWTSPPKAEPRTRPWEQVVHLRGDPRTHERGSEKVRGVTQALLWTAGHSKHSCWPSPSILVPSVIPSPQRDADLRCYPHFPLGWEIPRLEGLTPERSGCPAPGLATKQRGSGWWLGKTVSG